MTMEKCPVSLKQRDRLSFVTYTVSLMAISKGRVRNPLSSRQHHLNMHSAFHFEKQWKFG